MATESPSPQASALLAAYLDHLGRSGVLRLNSRVLRGMHQAAAVKACREILKHNMRGITHD